MDSYKSIFDEHLRSKNLKMTEQRLLILETVFSLHEHFTVELLYDLLKQNNASPEVSLSTVYRTIPLLVECGLVAKVGTLNDKDSFEHTYGHPLHVHIVCKSCDSIIEEDETKGIFKEIKKIINKYDFQIDDFSLTIKGVCDACRKK